MPSGLKVMLLWSLVFPLFVTALVILTDYFLGRDIILISYSGLCLGIVAVGLMLGGPLHYFIVKSKENKAEK